MNMYKAMKQCLRAKYTHVENAGDFAIERDGNILKLFFEWSDDVEDWINNFDFMPVSQKDGESVYNKIVNGLKYLATVIKAWKKESAIPKKAYKKMPSVFYCHGGFLNVWKSIEPYLVEEISNPEVKKIEIVGYSHGAAIGLLCYEYCIFNRPDCDVQGVGFGCPRVFWGIVPKTVKERFKNYKVVRNGRDIVTHVPPALFGFRHISEVVEIGQGESKGAINDHRSENYLLHLKTETK